MKIQVTIFDDKSIQDLEVSENATAYEVLKKLELQPDTLIVTRNDQPIPIDEELNNRDRLKLIRVISGG